MKICPVILCGGAGTRLWPLSRRKYPKQFMDLGGHTLFEDTLQRLAAVPGLAAPVVICNEEQRFLAAAALQRQGLNGRILLDASGKEWRLHDGKLADVAPTLLRMWGIAQPEAMTGTPLVEEAHVR